MDPGAEILIDERCGCGERGARPAASQFGIGTCAPRKKRTSVLRLFDVVEVVLQGVAKLGGGVLDDARRFVDNAPGRAPASRVARDGAARLVGRSAGQVAAACAARPRRLHARRTVLAAAAHQAGQKSHFFGAGAAGLFLLLLLLLLVALGFFIDEVDQIGKHIHGLGLGAVRHGVGLGFGQKFLRLFHGGGGLIERARPVPAPEWPCE